MSDNKGAFHSMKGQAGRSAFLKLFGGKLWINFTYTFLERKGSSREDEKDNRTCTETSAQRAKWMRGGAVRQEEKKELQEKKGGISSIVFWG